MLANVVRRERSFIMAYNIRSGLCVHMPDGETGRQSSSHFSSTTAAAASWVAMQYALGVQAGTLPDDIKFSLLAVIIARTCIKA